MTAHPYLLDTNVLLHLIRGRDLGRYISVTFDLANAVHRPLVSIVTHGEIGALADRHSWGTDKQGALTKMLNSLVTISLDDQAILDAYVYIDRACRSMPKGAIVLSQNDLWIASTTRAADALLLTTDKDFLPLHPNHCLVHWIDPKLKLAGQQSGSQTTLP